MLFFKKVERVMSSLTQLQSILNLRFTSYNVSDKSEKVSLMSILEKMKIEGILRIDDKTP
jgi:hypothetical protein